MVTQSMSSGGENKHVATLAPEDWWDAIWINYVNSNNTA